VKPAWWKSRSIARQISLRSNTDALLSSSSGAYWIIMLSRCSRSSLLKRFFLRAPSSPEAVLAGSARCPVAIIAYRRDLLDPREHFSQGGSLRGLTTARHAQSTLVRLLFRRMRSVLPNLRRCADFSPRRTLALPRAASARERPPDPPAGVSRSRGERGEETPPRWRARSHRGSPRRRRGGSRSYAMIRAQSRARGAQSENNRRQL